MRQTLYPVILLVLLFLVSFSASERKKLLVIGDSISLGYGPELKNMLAAKFYYETKNANANAGNLDFPTGPNAGDSRMVLNYLRSLQKQRIENADLMLLNCGLHDIKIDRKTNKIVIDAKHYAANLDSILSLLKKMKQPTIWVKTTPVNDSIHNSKDVGFYRFNKDVIRYNQIADSLCNKYKIPVIDLYHFSAVFPVSAYSDHIHFKPEYAKFQAAYIAGFIANVKIKTR